MNKLIRSAAVAAITLTVAGGMAWAAAKPAAVDGKARLLKYLKAIQASTFEFKNSDSDQVKGFVTYSAPASSKYVAYVFVDWGDLNNLITKGGKQYYSNWDGSLKLDAGTAEVVRKFAFDDGTNVKTGAPKTTKTTAKAHAVAKNAGPGEGSGRDALITTNDPTEVAWKAGVVGATDGLLIKLTLDTPQGTGILKAGKFTIPIVIKPAPASATASKN